MSSRVAAFKSIVETALSGQFQGFKVPPLPENATFPYITCQEIGGPDMQTLEGRNGLSMKVMQINCWSKSYEEAWVLREAVKIVLCDLAVTIGVSAGATTLHVLKATDHELYDGLRELHQLITSYVTYWGADVIG